MSVPAGCDAFEETLFLAQHRPLAPEQELALREHLQGCARCRALQAQLTQLDAALASVAPAKPSAPGDALERCRKIVHERGHNVLRVLAVLSAMTAAVAIATRSWSVAWHASLPVAAVIVPLVLWMRVRSARALAAAGERHDALVALYCRSVRADLRRLRALRIVLPVSSFALLSKAAAANPHRTVVAFLAVSSGVVVACAAWWSLRTIPRLSRALADVEGAPS